MVERLGTVVGDHHVMALARERAADEFARRLFIIRQQYPHHVFLPGVPEPAS
jgi:hypothetical protein